MISFWFILLWISDFAWFSFNQFSVCVCRKSTQNSIYVMKIVTKKTSYVVSVVAFVLASHHFFLYLFISLFTVHLREFPNFKRVRLLHCDTVILSKLQSPLLIAARIKFSTKWPQQTGCVHVSLRYRKFVVLRNELYCSERFFFRNNVKQALNEVTERQHWNMQWQRTTEKCCTNDSMYRLMKIFTRLNCIEKLYFDHNQHCTTVIRINYHLHDDSVECNLDTNRRWQKKETKNNARTANGLEHLPLSFAWWSLFPSTQKRNNAQRW